MAVSSFESSILEHPQRDSDDSSLPYGFMKLLNGVLAEIYCKICSVSMAFEDMLGITSMNRALTLTYQYHNSY